MLLSLLLLLPVRASATTADLMGLGARPTALGGALSTGGSEATSIFYNPGGLTFVEGHHVGAGFVYGSPVFEVDGERSGSYEERALLTFSSWRFGGAQAHRFAFGLSIYMPVGAISRFRIKAPDEPNFFLYENNVQALQLRFGAACRIPILDDRISVGGTVMLLSSLNGQIRMTMPVYVTRTVDEANAERVLLTTNQNLLNTAFFGAGAVVDLGGNWRWGLVYRGESYSNVDLQVDVNTLVQGTVPLHVLQDIHIKVKHTVPRIATGVSHLALDGRLFAALDLEWIYYESYEVPYASVYPQIADLDELLSIYPPKEPRIRLVNVLVPRLGVEYWVLPWAALRAGYAYETSPVRDVNMPVYDADKHSASVGCGLRISGALLGDIGGEIALNAAFQLVHLESRQFTFPGEDGGIESHTVGGNVYTGALDVGIRF